MLLVVAHDPLGDLAAVEGRAGRFEPRHPSSARARPLLVGHVLKRGGEVTLDEPIARLRRRAAREIDRSARRPAAVVVGVLGDVVGQVLVDREPVAGIAGRRGGDVREAHRPVVAQRRDPRVGRRGDDRVQDPRRDLAAVLAHEQVGGEARRPVTQTGDRPQLARAGPDHDRRHPGDVDLVGMQDAERDPGRAPGVDGVAPGLEDRVAGRGRQVVARRDRVSPAIQGRAPRVGDRASRGHPLRRHLKRARRGRRTSAPPPRASCSAGSRRAPLRPIPRARARSSR